VNSLAIRRALIAAVAAAGALAASTTLGATAANASTNCGDAATWYGVTLKGFQYLTGDLSSPGFASKFAFDNDNGVTWSILGAGVNSRTDTFKPPTGGVLHIDSANGDTVDLTALSCQNGQVKYVKAVSTISQRQLQTLPSRPLTAP
jgi:hypothetical protein